MESTLEGGYARTGDEDKLWKKSKPCKTRGSASVVVREHMVVSRASGTLRPSASSSQHASLFRRM